MVSKHDEWLADQTARERRTWLHDLKRETGERYGPERVSLDNYEVKHAGQQQVLDRIRALASRLPEAVKGGESVVLFGCPGTGKDHLLASLAHIAIREHGLSVFWTSGAGFFECERRAQRSRVYDMDWSKKLNRHIVVLTDPVLPGGDASAWCMERLFALVDRRYAEMRPTWMSVNVRDEKDLKAKLTVQVYDRLRDHGHIIPCFWESYRGR
jgi:DNA replication protein DnaC